MDPKPENLIAANIPVDSSLPKAAQALRVEGLLSEMKIGDTIALSKDLSPVVGREEVVISFKKNSDTEYSVLNGNVSYNNTIARISGHEVTVTLPVFLKSGDTISMGAHNETISADFAQQNVSELSKAIANLQPNQSLIIGRVNFPTLDKTVSRRHCTLTRLEDIEGRSGITTKLFELSDGARTAHAVSVSREEGEWKSLVYSQTLVSGNKIKLVIDGSEVSLTIPSPPVYDYAHALRANLDLESVLGVNTGQTLFARAPTDSESIVGSRLHAVALGEYISAGIKLIRNGDYKEAHKHFTHVSALKVCGFDLQENRTYFSDAERVTEDIAKQLLYNVAANSWFRPLEKLVYPSFGVLTKKGGPPTAEEQEIINSFNREVVLLYAEEWVHAYQHFLNGNVCKKAELFTALPQSHKGPLGFNSSEIDVAQFFKEQKMPMSPVFLERYGRAKALLMLKHYSSTEEQKFIRDRIISASIGRPIIIGLDSSQARTSKFKGFDKFDLIGIARSAEIDKEQLVLREQNIEAQLRSRHVAIVPLGAGKYKVMPLAPEDSNGKVFRRDNYGIWRTITKTQELLSGTTLRLGAAFEFSLP